MAQMADITVKKSDGVTNVTYSAQSPSSGDKTAAIWKLKTAGTAVGFQPELRLTAQGANGQVAAGVSGPVRKLRATFFYPQLVTNTTTGITSVYRQAMSSSDHTLPTDMSAADVAEYAAQFANLLASALIQSCVKEGYSAS